MLNNYIETINPAFFGVKPRWKVRKSNLEEEVTPLSEWIYQKYDEDEYTYNMPQFSSRGFFEDYADNVKQAVEAMDEFRRSHMRT